MHLTKKIISLLTAVLLVFFATADITSRAAYSETSDKSSGSNETNSPGDVDIDNTEKLYGSEEYTPDESLDYRQWSGGTGFKENLNYYIDKPIKISGEKHIKLPESSRLLIKDGGSLTVYSDSLLEIKGELTIEPSAKLIVSGEFAPLKRSKVLNYGTFCATESSVCHLSSVFFTGRKGITSFSGGVNIYKSGTVVDCGRLTFAKNSDVTLSGKLIGQENGMIFIKGAFCETMNGETEFAGKLFLYSNATISGYVTLLPGSKLYRLDGGKLTLTKCGKLKDESHRTPFKNLSERNASLPEYDSEPEEVNWKGIDVSRYQGAIDWERVKASGVDFVLLRSSIGDGTDYISGEDIRFAKNAVEAKEAGLMVGAYHYLWAETVADARKEARFFIKTISPYTLDFPAVLDFEEPSQQENLTNAERTAIAKAFMDEVKNAGYYPMLYTNKNWATTYLDMDELADYDLWIAEWYPKPTYEGDFGVWQYTPYGKISGIASDVDLNICRKNYRKLILDGGYNHLK